MTAILMNENIDGNDVKVYQCGGSLIHPSVVLTGWLIKNLKFLHLKITFDF